MPRPGKRKGKGKHREKPPRQKAQIVRTRPLDKFNRSGERGNPNVPIRTVICAEVGDMPSGDVNKVMGALKKGMSNNEHPHYFVPVRHGKMTSDVRFEEEILKMINQLCEIKEDKIVLKGGARKVEIIRKRV